MISYNLSCNHGHAFECWFSSSTDYDDQQERGLVRCPYCDSSTIKKALMAPNVTAKSNQQKPTGLNVEYKAEQIAPSETQLDNLPALAQQQTNQQITAQMAPEMQEMMGEAIAEMRKFQKTVETNCDNVGDGFANEARKIHYGEAEPRGIYGRTTDKEAEELVDEGIEIAKMPWLPKEH